MKSSIKPKPPEGRTIRTLIVDDSHLVRTMLLDFLRCLPGVEVVGTAADGKDALALMLHRPTDLVLMDVNMPIMDGLQATGRIREQHPGTRIIIMSLSFTAAIKTRCLRAGADAFISKEDIHHALAQAIVRLFPGSDPFNPPAGGPSNA
jgi:DNA-binding NarL/FixJ family response regulator